MSYAPPALTTVAPGLSHKATVYYMRKGLDKLKASLYFDTVCDAKELPRNNGRTMQAYRFDLPAANTNPVVDGTINSAIPMTSSTIVWTVEEYNDFTSTSRLYDETDISEEMTEMVEFMSYRGALTWDNILRTEFDSVSAAQVSPIGVYFSAADVRRNVAALEGLNVSPRDGGFQMITHPYNAYDLCSDNTAGGFIDVSKYAQPEKLLNGEIGKIHKTRVVESTNVTTSGSAPNVIYSSYLVGKGAVAKASLAGSGPTGPANPDNMNFRLKITRSPEGGAPFDPAGTLGTFVAYRFVATAKNLGTDQSRFRRIDSDTSVV